MINCPNPSCNDLNAEDNAVCQTCQSVLPHRYLWGVGQQLSTLRPGELYQNRYLLKRDRIFLDTQPGLVPESLPELPRFLRPYLHLSAYPIHTPKPYSIMRASADDYVLMLESSALSTPALNGQGVNGKQAQPTQLPKLSTQWAEAPPLRQLSWLWQISQIWEAFIAEQVATTLLTDEWVRVDGSVVRLLELASLPVSPTNVRAKLQPETQPTLMALGRYWQPLAEKAHQSVRIFLDGVCEKLERQQLNAEQLTDQLSRAIAECGVGQVVSYEMAVHTDQGPTRKRNEDACYPASGTHLTFSSEKTQEVPQLLIVCDGIGGHQGGDVASKLAIATIESCLEPLLSENALSLTSTELSLAIEEAICAANDEISAQNDKAQRQARDRMGTTLVLALVRGIEVYIAHLGDSRAYRVGRQNCQQITLDDDVASRQVRLGGSLYREVLVQPGSGSLIQALGMGASQMLRPTVQRFLLDENCVFLLCSDGLSDSDRVEQFWPQVLWPLVASEKSTAESTQQLIHLANKFNGHDNVTVGVLSAQVVRSSERMLPRELAKETAAPLTDTVGRAAQNRNNQNRNERGASNKRDAARGNTKITSIPSALGSSAPDSSPPGSFIQSGEPERTLPPKTKPQPNKTQKSSQTAQPLDVPAGASAVRKTENAGVQRIGLFVGLLAVTAIALYFLFPGLSWQFRSASETEDSALPSSESRSGGAVGEASSQPLANVAVGQYLRIVQTDLPIAVDDASVDAAAADVDAPDADSTRLLLYPNPTVGPNDIPGAIPTGGIVKVLEQQSADQTEWAKLKLCSIPSGDSIADVPSETDAQVDQPTTGEPLRESSVNQPLVLSPEAEGWAVAASLATVAENVQDLDPTQQGQCER